MIDPQLRRVLSLIKEEGSVFVFENCDPDEEFPGISRGEESGLIKRQLGSVGLYFELTAAGREVMGMSPTFGDRMWRYLRSFGLATRPTVKP
ncbi:hypothetical protein FHS26_004320 [Rhizobium pisi]|uniref:Transcriptional regulator n=2 Tax=Rhizobium TaxID=379 RepID=A0A7W6B4R5_9HYPH|nr:MULTISPECIES: hypothetical protein [Rhizobium]MBB3136565.1 hypothetical protein [Rhizobium pisi]MBB3915582.1 hypothetical protein [Rhizobium fabae]RSB67126.1 hypothetical protein EFD55_21685 [Rhizobium pisi]RUM11837.1 hypothetical protein EFB14_15725 [Rhizobium fabae]TCA53812.1 hypothetical protein E0J16_17670 [Rhizobium pisi]